MFTAVCQKMLWRTALCRSAAAPHSDPSSANRRVTVSVRAHLKQQQPAYESIPIELTRKFLPLPSPTLAVHSCLSCRKLISQKNWRTTLAALQVQHLLCVRFLSSIKYSWRRICLSSYGARCWERHRRWWRYLLTRCDQQSASLPCDQQLP